jgi:hypothetical protein
MPDCNCIGNRSECRLAGLVRPVAKVAQSGKTAIAEDAMRDASARPDYTYLNIRMRSWSRAIASQAVAVNVRRAFFYGLPFRNADIAGDRSSPLSVLVRETRCVKPRRDGVKIDAYPGAEAAEEGGHRSPS